MQRSRYFRFHFRAVTLALLFSLILAALLAPTAGAMQVVAGPQAAAPFADARTAAQQDAVPDAPAANEQVILSYAAKFVCTEALQPGQFWYGLNAPIIEQKTDVLVHNPNGYPVTLFKKAVLAPIEDPATIEQGVAPGKYVKVTLRPDYAFRINCDDIAKLLTGNANATFIGTYGIGVTVEGFVVVGIGPQTLAGTTVRRQGILDVTAEYVRASEFLKKDIHFQPWWRWWWWNLPWQLGYAYQRVIPINPGENIDCRAMLYQELEKDVQDQMASSPDLAATMDALAAGRHMVPGAGNTPAEAAGAESPPALVALIGDCAKVAVGQQLAMSVDYLLVSNKSNAETNPRTGNVPVQVAIRYPWFPGHWYDLALVTPQNLDVDIDDYFRTWQSQRWIAAGATSATVSQVMPYWFPYWCGWGYWWWWNNSGDCIDIAVGNAQSLDVEQVTPVRVFMPQWPPTP
jgi:hypothetical protein